MSCNTDKKQGLPTWAMSNVQALVIGFPLSSSEAQLVEKSYSFALHCYAARRLATRKKTTLKVAFLKLGPWTNVRARDEDDISDFFNLINHQDNTDLW
jgi:hypothetical protein